jgi:hypothetical protein
VARVGIGADGAQRTYEADVDAAPAFSARSTLWRLLTINQPVGSRWNGVAPRSRTRFNRKAARKRANLLNALSGC